MAFLLFSYKRLCTVAFGIRSANLPGDKKQNTMLQKFPEKCMQLRERLFVGGGGGGISRVQPLRSATEINM